jgi:hypothetical protein
MIDKFENRRKEDEHLQFLTEKIIALSEDMAKYATRIESYPVTCAKSMGEMAEIVKKHDFILLGSPGTDGLVVATDRLTNKEKERTKERFFIWGTIASLAIASWWKYLVRIFERQ